MLKLTVVISVFLLAACVEAAPRTWPPRLAGRIVGGVTANISEVPYQLSLEVKERHVCGAAIIHEYFAVTAAHCVAGLPIIWMRLRAGSSVRETGGSVHAVEEVLVHPEYDFSSIEYDVAVILVSEPFVLGENVRPIAIANSEPAPGTMATVSGWGAMYFEVNLPCQLHKVEVPIVDHDKCNKTYHDVEFGDITKNMICAGDEEEEGGKDACLKDDGDPLVVGEELVGIVSLVTCGMPGLPGVYANLPVLSQEFRKMMHNHPRFKAM